MNRIKKALAAGAIAATAAVGVPAFAPADSGAVQAAEAVPYKIARGTWGAQYHYVDRYAGCSNGYEYRYREDFRRWYDGNKWVNKAYYQGTYWATDLRGYARRCTWA